MDEEIMKMIKVLKFELKNILRSRWIFGYSLVMIVICSGLNYFSNDLNKVLVSLALILPLLVPLVTLIYTSLHWYYNERFTILLLTQPISRQIVLKSRYLALGFSLSLSVIVGIMLPFIFRLQSSALGSSEWLWGLALVLFNSVILTLISVGIGLWISSSVMDRLKGIGLAFCAWIYLSILHDGVLLALLILFRDTPMDLIAGLFSSLNPISLSRVVQLMFFDQPLLLGHTGALTKQILISWKGFALASSAAILWIVLPFVFTIKSFRHKNF